MAAVVWRRRRAAAATTNEVRLDTADAKCILDLKCRAAGGEVEAMLWGWCGMYVPKLYVLHGTYLYAINKAR